MTDLLTLANQLDDAWHRQSRSFEREAVTRFWGLLTMPARALDPELPRQLLRHATVLRNARFEGRLVEEMFFSNKRFTEIDAVFFDVGSPLGHLGGRDAWVVEVERKQAHGHGDYYLAIQRARRFCELLERRFGVRGRPVVVYEDNDGQLSARTFDEGVLLITMSELRDRTRGLRFETIADLPGAGSDRLLVKLGLLRQLIDHDPNIPGAFPSALALAETAERNGWPMRLPVYGHQNVDTLPTTLPDWFAVAAQPAAKFDERIRKYVDELVADGLLEAAPPHARLTYQGGDAVLRVLRAAG